MAVRDRLHRSELAVPGSNTRAMEKAPGLGADVVFLDLEDAVAPDDKEQARENVIAALTGQDWSACSVCKCEAIAEPTGSLKRSQRPSYGPSTFARISPSSMMPISLPSSSTGSCEMSARRMRP